MESSSSIVSINFLNPGIREIKKSIREIDESYNNEWDYLAEPIQNAVDAIREKYSEGNLEDYNGEIYIYVNAQTKEIRVKDNGIGISPDRLPELLKPFSSDKDTDPNTVGEKGVGLTFTIFNSNEFKIYTGNGEGSVTGIIQGAMHWKNDELEEDLKVELLTSENNIQGTEVQLKHMGELEIFELSDKQLEYVIRTKTAIGNTNQIWEDDINISVEMEFVDINNEVHQRNIPFEYYLLPDYLQSPEKIELDEFKDTYSNVRYSDADKRRALSGKVIYKKGTIYHNNHRKINYYSYFLPTRSTWDNLNELMELSSVGLEESNEEETFNYAHLNSGIYTALKGMPTGITIDSPTTGNAGYWANMFIIFQDNRLKFDIGRKSIHGSQSNILKNHARKIFNEYTNVFVRYGSRDNLNDTNRGEWSRDNIYSEIEAMADMSYISTSFTKYPTKQEAQVVAMFYEQIGKGNIQEFTLLTSGYKSKYDLYAKWGDKRVVIEFKAELRTILKDFSDAQKLFNEINCIVCWDVSEEDIAGFHSKGISLTPLEGVSRIGMPTEILPNATHQLDLSGFVRPIYVIDLKKIIESADTSGR